MYLRSPFLRCLNWVGGCSVGFCTGVASGSYRCFFSLHCLATSVCASSCSSFFLSSCFPASGFFPPASSLLPSSSLAWPVSSAPGLGSPPLVSVVPCLPAVLYLALRYFQLPLFCSAPLGSSAGLYGFAYPLSGTSEAPCLPAVILLSAPGFQRPLLLLLFALLLLTPLQVSLAFPRLRLAPYLVSLALLRLLLRCLGLLRLLPSSSLSVWLGSYCPFAPGLLLWSLPVLWLQFLRLSFLTFACLRLRWCLPCISIVIW